MLNEYRRQEQGKSLGDDKKQASGPTNNDTEQKAALLDRKESQRKSWRRNRRRRGSAADRGIHLLTLNRMLEKRILAHGATATAPDPPSTTNPMTTPNVKAEEVGTTRGEAEEEKRTSSVERLEIVPCQ